STRRRILETAGRLFKQDGIDGTGIATMMADAGLTNGAFYAHFRSKEELVAAVIAEELRVQATTFTSLAPGIAGVETLLRTYLSVQHRDHREGRLPICCPARRDRTLWGIDSRRVRRGRERAHRANRVTAPSRRPGHY